MTFNGREGMASSSTADPTGHTGWTEPLSLAPWIGAKWAKNAIPGPGAALAVALPPPPPPPPHSSGGGAGVSTANTAAGERLLFCAHAGAYTQDATFYSDNAGETFNVSASTPYNVEENVLQGMDECAFAQLHNGSIVLIMRNFGGYHEHDPRGLYNPRCRDHGICKAYSRSDDLGLTWNKPQYFADVRSGSCEAGALGNRDGLFISVGDSDAPPNTGRMRMMLHRSRDAGATWEDGLLLDANRSAYSQLVVLDSRPGEVGVLWEALSPDQWFVGEMRLQWVAL